MTVNIVPSQNISEEDIARAHIARTGLQCLLSAVSNAIPGMSTTPKPTTTDQAKGWLTSCVKTYFERFHERWTILHAPTFDERSDDTLLVATTVLIGSWYRDPERVRDYIVSIHVRLIHHLLRALVSYYSSFYFIQSHGALLIPSQTMPPKDSQTNAAWPFETYQMALLNIIFAFETGVSQF